MDIADIGLVHLSGVEDARPRENLTDDERIMLTEKIGCIPVSKSNTSKPGVIRGVCVRTVCAGAGIRSEEDIRRETERSIALIQRHCA